MNSSTPQPKVPDGPEFGGMRREYGLSGLRKAELAADWVSQFTAWLSAAADSGLHEPNAMVFATADAAGRPSARTVLLKAYDQRGFVLFTNYRSRKGVEARGNPYGSLVFFWSPLHRQVVACGSVEPVSREETEAYFATRPRGAQLAAWASPQSEVVASRDVLDDEWRRQAAQRPGRLPAPAHWGGLRVVPETVEFWQGRQSRMHDRLRYRRAESGWVVERLAP